MAIGTLLHAIVLVPIEGTKRVMEVVKKKIHNNTPLGKIEKIEKLLQKKKNEIDNAMSTIRKDIQKHSNQISELERDLRKKQLPPIIREIEKQILNNNKRVSILEKLIQNFHSILAPLEYIENGIDSMLKITKFNSGRTKIKTYKDCYLLLKDELLRFSENDFIEGSQNVIDSLASSTEYYDLEADLGEVEHYTEQHSHEPKLELEDYANVTNENFDKLILKSLEESTKDFDKLNKSLKKLFRKR